ncbi:MAG: proline--tRNA ligase [Candidatus Omnitrophota bacterium]
MYWSKYFIPTLKEVPSGAEAVSHQLSLRAGLVNMLTSGVYSYLPLGLRVLNRIEQIIREEMNAAGAHEVLLPCLHPVEIWEKTGRVETMKDVMIQFKDQKGRRMCLGPTHEEIITDLARQYVQSYRQLPVTLYQIQTKFRDEMRPRFGIVRACEFIMKDAYSFDKDADGLKKNYDLMYEAYKKIFSRCGLEVTIVEADSGAMGGSLSHEFMVSSDIGEDAVVCCEGCGFRGGVNDALDNSRPCPQCRKSLKKIPALEIGHIFQLGTKYSAALGGLFVDEDGKQKPMIMGCYGIGVSRLIAALIEVHHDDKGIKWPEQVAPFNVEILPLQIGDEQTMSLARRYYQELQSQGFEVLIDDRDESAGRKFNDADLIGIPYRIVIGKRNLQTGHVELKNRLSGETKIVGFDEVTGDLVKGAFHA